MILTSRLAVDHYFRLAKEMRFDVPDAMKYFCISESTAYYLQKYVQYRKRKIFHGTIKFDEVIALMKKHKNEKVLVAFLGLAQEQHSQCARRCWL